MQFQDVDTKTRESGAAIIMAISFMILLSWAAFELMEETSVEFVANAQALHQVRAYYAAKAGVDISLLRLQIYRKAMATVGNNLPPGTLDPVWNIPFAWPPPPLPGMSEADKSLLNDILKNSLLGRKTSYVPVITSEGGKIDINDLDSPSKGISDLVRNQIFQIFKNKVIADNDFAVKYQNYDFAALLNDMVDWLDFDKTSLNGGSENSRYTDLEDADNLPPNQSFKSIEELRMLPNMNDDIFNLLKEQITIYGSKGVNVNYANKEVLMALSPQITSERAGQIVEARSNPLRGPFRDKNDFVAYLNTIGINGDPFKTEGQFVPLVFDPEFSFRIISTGQSGKVFRTITALVVDLNKAKIRLKNAIDSDEALKSQQSNPQQSGQQPPPGQTQQPGDKKPDSKPTPAPDPNINKKPQIVYWFES